MWSKFNFFLLLVINIINRNELNASTWVERADDDLHLPTAVVPFHQFIYLQPFYEGSEMSVGYTEILLKVTEPTSGITFHMAGLHIDESSVKVINQETLDDFPISGFFYSNNTEMVSIILDSEALQPGITYNMGMNFTSTLSDNLFGLYGSYYTNQVGEHVEFAVSQFAPIYARWSFPCFDEPTMKVNFSIQIKTPSNLTALSNMPVLSSEILSDSPFWRVDTFQESPTMSSYLLAFLVSDFVKKSVVVDDVTYGVWATSNGISQTDYALNITPNITKFFGDFTSIPYSSMMSKMDMAAVPDFYFGAMENWGLILYQETRMLYNSELSSALDKQSVCLTIAHELSHMWFGNLVTFQWWNDVWLNEGFASFMENFGCNAVEPTFGLANQFLLNDMQKALGVDSLASSKALSPDITKLSDIYQVYNTIAYSKGASIIRMMLYFLTPSTLQLGLRNYLKDFSYGNAQHDDLWASLTEQGHADKTLDDSLTVKQIMDPWTLMPGYPVLTVHKFDNGTVFLNQNRFLEISNSTLENVVWSIPITYVTENNPDFNQTKAVLWMTEQSMNLPNDIGIQPNQWIIFNVQQNGYYRVNYDNSNWNKLIIQFQENHEVINTANRAQIIDDGYSLAKTGQLDYNTILSINSYLGNEDDYVPMKTALDRLNYLYIMFLRSSISSAFKDYMTSLVVPIYEEYGFADSLDDMHSVQLKRALVVDWACKLEVNDCTTNAIQIYSQWMLNPSNNSMISPNLITSVYCTAISRGSEIEWDFAYDRYLTSNIPNQRRSLIYGMGCTTDEALIIRYMDMAFTASSGIRQQDIDYLFTSLAENLYGRDLAWEFIENNTALIANYMGSSKSVVDLTNIVTETFNTLDNLVELEEFESDQSSILGSNSLDQSEEVVQNNIEWMNTYYGVINDWLAANGFAV